MKKFLLFITITASLFAVGCSKRGASSVESLLEEPLPLADSSTIAPISGDSSIYALACDGSNDTVLVYLHNARKDPDTINILQATKRHTVFGTIRTGSRVAIVRSGRGDAALVVSLSSFCHTWARLLKPVARQRPGITAAEVRRLNAEIIESEKGEGAYPPLETSMQLSGDRSVRVTLPQLAFEEDSPVDYPLPVAYNEWTLCNGKLILSSIGRDSTGTLFTQRSDTATLLLLRKDSLALRVGDDTFGFYIK